MAGKLSAKERLAKLKAMQGKRGEEFAGGKKKPAPEPPQTPAQEEPSVFDKPPAAPVKEEPDEGNKTQGLDLDDSAIMELEDDSAPAAPPAPAEPVSPVVQGPEAAEEEPQVPEAEPAPSGPSLVDSVQLPEPSAQEAEPAPSLDDLVPPAGLDAALDIAALDAALGPVEPSSTREDETKPEVPQRPSRSPGPRLMSVEEPADPLDVLRAPEEAKAPEEGNAEPEGVKYHVNSSARGEQTKLGSGIVAKYVIASGSNKIFTVDGPKSSESIELAPGDSKSFEMATLEGKVQITMQNTGGEVKAYVVGGVTKAGAAMAKAGAAGQFLANVRYYLPEVTMAGLFTVATSAVLWTQQFISDTLQNFHKPAVIAYGIIQFALTTWAIIEQRRNRRAAEAQEAVKD